MLGIRAFVTVFSLPDIVLPVVFYGEGIAQCSGYSKEITTGNRTMDLYCLSEEPY